jgi:hypothetical protein
MFKISSVFFAALLVLVVGVGSVNAKPKEDKPNSGAATIPFKVNQTHTYGGEWRCTGNYVVNKNRERIHVECNVSDVASLPVGPGTYSSATHNIADYVDSYSGDATRITGIPMSGNWGDWTWTVTITASDNGSGHVSGVAFLEQGQ